MNSLCPPARELLGAGRESCVDQERCAKVSSSRVALPPLCKPIFGPVCLRVNREQNRAKHPLILQSQLFLARLHSCMHDTLIHLSRVRGRPQLTASRKLCHLLFGCLSGTSFTLRCRSTNGSEPRPSLDQVASPGKLRRMNHRRKQEAGNCARHRGRLQCPTE